MEDFEVETVVCDFDKEWKITPLTREAGRSSFRCNFLLQIAPRNNYFSQNKPLICACLQIPLEIEKHLPLKRQSHLDEVY